MRSPIVIHHRARLLATLALLLIASPFGSLAGIAVAETHDHDEHEGEAHVPLTATQLVAFGVTLATAGPGKIDGGIEILGEVGPNGDNLAHIVPRFPGIVLSVRKSVGDTVNGGDVLATIQSNESLAPYELKTLIAGTIIEKHLTRGEAIDRDTPAYVIADLATVWVDLSVYQKDLQQISVGQAVRVSAGYGLPDIDGVISYIAPVVDQPTRTTVARVVLPNAERRLRPGLFVTARILDSMAATIAIPRTAIQLVENRSAVFVESTEGFEPRPLTLGRSGESMVEVLGGLVAGDRYVATNSFLLKAELGKGTAEHDH